jgi:hypothetical protein
MKAEILALTLMVAPVQWQPSQPYQPPCYYDWQCGTQGIAPKKSKAMPRELKTQERERKAKPKRVEKKRKHLGRDEWRRRIGDDIANFCGMWPEDPACKRTDPLANPQTGPEEKPGESHDNGH